MDSALGTAGGAFLESELVLRDPKLIEPLTSYFYMRDCPIKTGGGWVEYTSNEFEILADVAPGELGLTSNSTSQISFVDGTFTKQVWPTYVWQKAYRISDLDLQKSQMIGRSLDALYNRAVRLAYNKTVDEFVYKGNPANGTAGLVNQPSSSGVTITSLPATGTGSSTNWVNKTPLEILNDVNGIISSQMQAGGFSREAIPNRILIPFTQFTYLNQPMTTAGSISTMDYLKRNNLALQFGVDLEIYPSPYCSGVGVSGTDRLVAYVFDDETVHFNICVPLERSMTQPTFYNGPSFLVGFRSNLGCTKVLRPTNIGYYDGV